MVRLHVAQVRPIGPTIMNGGDARRTPLQYAAIIALHKQQHL
jgi:hypothetical protein